MMKIVQAVSLSLHNCQRDGSGGDGVGGIGSGPLTSLTPLKLSHVESPDVDPRL